MTENMIKEYFKKKKKDTALNKYANFNFLVYLAKVVDVQTAENICKQIYEENLDTEVLGYIMDSILQY